MKLQFVSYDNIDIIKSNLKSWVDNFKQDSSDWLQEELGNALFSDTKFAEIPDFSLDMTADKPFLTALFLRLWRQTFFDEKCFIQTVVDRASYI